MLGKPGEPRALDYGLAFAHWAWFLQPHAAVAWILWQHPERFPRAAASMCAVFDLGLIGYFAVPTAPPWWAAEKGRITGLRRIMEDVGRRFWGRLWAPLYGFLGGNPLAAAAAIAAVTAIQEEGLVENARDTGGYFQKKLKALKTKHKEVADVRGLGLMLALEFANPIARTVASRCMENGLIVNAIGDKVLRFVPPLTLTQEQVDSAVAIIEAALVEP
jgi:hypothetical protein